MRFLRILFMRSRQKVMTSLALMYSCPSKWNSCPKNRGKTSLLYYLGQADFLRHSGGYRGPTEGESIYNFSLVTVLKIVLEPESCRCPATPYLSSFSRRMAWSTTESNALAKSRYRIFVWMLFSRFFPMECRTDSNWETQERFCMKPCCKFKTLTVLANI